MKDSDNPSAIRSRKVITDHSTIGLVITTDGSITDVKINGISQTAFYRAEGGNSLLAYVATDNEPIKPGEGFMVKTTANGTLTFNGGTVTVDGPTNSANSALDAEGTVSYNGGEIIAVGASGMAVAPGSSSTGYSLSVFFSQTYSAKTVLTVKDAAGNTILEHTSAKSFQHASLSSSNFQLGETYTIYLNGAEYTSVTLSAPTTQVGQGGMGGGMMPGGQGGRAGR